MEKTYFMTADTINRTQRDLIFMKKITSSEKKNYYFEKKLQF